MPNQGSKGVSCRQIGVDDLPAIVDLLSKGFPDRSRSYWVQGLRRLAAHTPPAGVPKFGYILVSESLPVGALLVIYSNCADGEANAIRCNVSSWFVLPEFRAYAPLLSLRATKTNAATHINVWPAEHTLSTIEAQGFSKATGGLVAGVPALSRTANNVHISATAEEWQRSKFISDRELRLLADHEKFGCVCLWCETSSGGHPFVFRKRLSGSLRLPGAMLIYANCLDDLEEFGGPVGRFLAVRGMPFVLAGSDRPLKWLLSRHFKEKLHIYFKGSNRPRGSDLSYTEVAMFGL